jgi:hypothetical protein
MFFIKRKIKIVKKETNKFVSGLKEKQNWIRCIKPQNNQREIKTEKKRQKNQEKEK